MGLPSSASLGHCAHAVLGTVPVLTGRGRRSFCPPLCSIGGSNRNPNVIKVVVNGAGSELGKAAVAAIHKARGMEVAGALDSKYQGQDAGEVAGLAESLEIPILNDIVMVLGSLSQGTSMGVFVDLDDPAAVYENVRQATAFGLKSVVGVPGLGMDKVGALSSFCEKASTGCIVAPSLSIGAVLLQQAAASAAFQYKHVEIIESQEGLSEYPSQQATQLASSLSGLGQMYNEGDDSKEFLTLSFRHDVTDVKALMPGLIMAIRRVVRLKSLVYGLEKIL
ncbi:dihydrodipicolinate reductase-like protein CRR1, chloroplastic isoform X2 [Physcomitrium patens]|uniref:Dihydrodipicolinate reductase N-terminal domain-containing protein n=1 Tax=Physcomitrium patens TaxID=3218 RepID=A0A7I4CB52_PHYPA|nr:dihydrodipicolinate reductase-like protein CRR1, chloroplastic isoform X2 [Physcomitrium patens]|eukprot:XP_024359335.1 dihydrodipicolinate reductase-like protein CRR1, chloroplastic isoform X2 [Physcomitrella patens]